jgi:hypothetical protein
LSHYRHREDARDAQGAVLFDVPAADGSIARYSRDDFDQIFVSTDAEEVRRQVDIGWVILDERRLDEPGRGPSSADLVPGIEGLRVGGVLRYEPGVTVTSYIFGYLRDDAVGEPVERQPSDGAGSTRGSSLTR